jgi:hypothetical protein
MSLRSMVAVLALLALAACTAAAQEPVTTPPPTGTLHFPGYPDAPPFTVVPRKDDLFFYPCQQCHEFMEPSDQVRALKAPHKIELDHGNGRIWCIQCHSMADRNMLWTMLKEPVDIDQAYIVCGGCHANKQRDWYYGGHGKRVGNWKGDRVLYDCTQCHDAHSPSIKPRKPQPPPPVRAGLKPETGTSHETRQIWERPTSDQDEQQEHPVEH